VGTTSPGFIYQSLTKVASYIPNSVKICQTLKSWNA